MRHFLQCCILSCHCISRSISRKAFAETTYRVKRAKLLPETLIDCGKNQRVKRVVDVGQNEENGIQLRREDELLVQRV